MNLTPSASAATTDAATPLQTRWVRLAGPQGDFDAYLATPPAGRGPGLLLLQEIFGVNPHIRGVAEQWALAGYTVLVPDLFWRERPRVDLGYVGADRDEALRLMKTLGRVAAVTDMQTAITWLRGQPELCTGRVAALGYCLGGRLAFAAAALCGVDAAVCYYGGGIAAQPDLADLAGRISVPVQFHHAGEDHAIPPEAVATVQAAM